MFFFTLTQPTIKMNSKAFWEDQNISSQVEWQKRYKRHRDLVEKIQTPTRKAAIDRKLVNNITRGRIHQEQLRQTQILKGNKHLVDKICEINEQSENRWRALTVPYRNDESLNVGFRKRQAADITKENIALVDRILSTKPNLDTSNFEKDFRFHNKQKQMITRYNKEKMALMNSLPKINYVSHPSLMLPNASKVIFKTNLQTEAEANELAISTLTQTLDLNFHDYDIDTDNSHSETQATSEGHGSFVTTPGERSPNNQNNNSQSSYFYTEEESEGHRSGYEETHSEVTHSEVTHREEMNSEEMNSEEDEGAGFEAQEEEEDYGCYDDGETYESQGTTLTENESFVLDSLTQDKQLTALMSMPSQFD